ncbi:dTDP-glucose 4,6-dehydratase [Candidatus Gottesmanbacteria bacterium]|nr:dTDP-glucose 4,6-dehydratase [Candidatus Gottesmanbacteria bacterium]
MRLLVTGGSGFIGTNFILYWLEHHPEDSILNIDKLTYAGNPENLKEIESNQNYHFVKGDICNVKLIDNIIKDIDILIHFAAESHVDRSITGPAPFIKTNIVGTYILLEAAFRHGLKRFHHISTDEVFGSLEYNDMSKFNERTSYNPRSPYSASKAASDHLVRSYWCTYGLPITITNCSNNYGPYQFPEKLIPLAITNLIENKKVPVYGDGLYIRDWLYVTDHCRAIESVLQKGKIGETYCVGGLTKDITNLEVIKKILKILGKGREWIEFVPDRPGHDRKYALDWSKIRNQLDWEPQYDFDTWLETTVEWYKNNQNWWRRLKKIEYHKYFKE